MVALATEFNRSADGGVVYDWGYLIAVATKA
jgi:hypothetical protein